MSDPQQARPMGVAKRAMGGRLRQVRVQLYGQGGVPALARSLGIPQGNWIHYENGVTIPGDGLLEMIVLTGVEPSWLLRAEGAMFRGTAPGGEDRWGDSLSVTG